MKWRTKKDLPGIPAGTVLEADVDSGVKGPENYYYTVTNYPDFFEKVEEQVDRCKDCLLFRPLYGGHMAGECPKFNAVLARHPKEPCFVSKDAEFVDVEIKCEGGRLGCEVPLWVWNDDGHPQSACYCTSGGLTTFAAFIGYVYKTRGRTVVSACERLYPREAALYGDEIGGGVDAIIPTHARFRMRK